MSAAQPLAEQLVECERWCAARSEKEWLPVAEQGLRILPAHRAELVRPLPGQEARPDGWLVRAVAMGFGLWCLIGLMLLGMAAMVYVMSFTLVEKTGHPFLYALPLSLPGWAMVLYLPLQMLIRDYELVLADDCLVVRRKVLWRFVQEWRLPVAGEVRVGLAYRGVQARRSAKHGGSFGQLSVVVASGEAEVVFGTDLGHEERARLAILIDDFYNGA